MTTPRITDLFGAIVRALVDNPEEVSIEMIEGTQTQVLEIRTAKNDVGKVIGKGGRTADAIRTIAAAVGAKDQRRIHVEILE